MLLELVGAFTILCVAELFHPRDKTEAEKHKQKIAAGEPFACPLHKCFVCEELEVESETNLQFAICVGLVLRHTTGNVCPCNYYFSMEMFAYFLVYI